MTKLKLIAFSVFSLFTVSILLSSCKEDSLTERELIFTKKGIPMNTAQVVPTPPPTAATGTIDVVYRKDTRVLTYTITWTGLSGPPTNSATFGPAIGIYGTADPGFMAFPAAPLATYPSGIVQSITSGFPAATSGSYTGTLFVDGAAVRESDLLNNKFYVMIRTAAVPYNQTGQIRGQIDFR